MERDRIKWPRPKAGSRSTSYQRARGLAIFTLAIFAASSVNLAGRVAWAGNSVALLIMAGVAIVAAGFAILQPWGRDL